MDFKEEIKLKQRNEIEKRLVEEKTNRFFISLRNVLKTDDGRRVVKHIFVTCGLTEPSYSSDTCYMAFREGQRSIAIALKQLINDEALIDVIMKEEL